MTARWARTARGWSVALLAGVLSAALHTSAGGSFPAPAVLLLAVLLSGLVSTALIGRAPSLPRLAATVAAGQITFHTVFTVFGSTAGVVLTTDPHAGHTGHAGHLLLPQTAADHAESAHTGAGMLLAHLAAGLISALLLTHGERALRAVKRLATSTLRLPPREPAVRPLPRPQSAGIDSTVAIPRTTTVLSLLRYRGPPAFLRAA